MIVCLAASQALAAYDFTGKTNANMLKDMKTWTATQWDENIRALLDTGDVSLIKRSLAVAEKAIGESKVPGVTSDLLSKILGENSALVGDKLGSAAPASLNEVAGSDDAVNLRSSNVNKTSVQEFLARHPEYAERYAKDNVEVEEEPTPGPSPISRGASK